MRRSCSNGVVAVSALGLCLVGLSASTASAQVPGMVSFQGVLKDGGGTPLSGPVTLDFRIFDSQSGTTGQVDMDGDGVVENTVGEDVKELATMATNGVVSVAFGPVSPSVFNGQPRFIEVTIVNPGPATALARVPMTTAPAVAEQLFARGTTTAAVTTDAAGNVGIGTDAATPYFSARLHVNNGQIAVSEPFQDQYVGVFIKGNYNGTGRAVVGSTSSGPQRGPFSLVTADTERLTIDTNGRVGIGTTSPDSKLHLRGSGGMLHFQTDSDAAGYDIIWSNFNDSPSAFKWDLFYSGSAGGSHLHLIPSDLGAALMTWTQQGSVGIGTTNPAEKLHVCGNIRASGSLIASSATIIVQGSACPDYVFDGAYAPMPLAELRDYVACHRHLPYMPAAAEIDRNGLDLGLNQLALLRTVEELTLHLFDAHDALESSSAKIASQQQELDKLSERVARLEALLAKSAEKGR